MVFFNNRRSVTAGGHKDFQYKPSTAFGDARKTLTATDYGQQGRTNQNQSRKLLQDQINNFQSTQDIATRNAMGQARAQANSLVSGARGSGASMARRNALLGLANTTQGIAGDARVQRGAEQMGLINAQNALRQGDLSGQMADQQGGALQDAIRIAGEKIALGQNAASMQDKQFGSKSAQDYWKMKAQADAAEAATKAKENAANNNIIGNFIGGAASALGSAFGLSDERAKKAIKSGSKATEDFLDSISNKGMGEPADFSLTDDEEAMRQDIMSKPSEFELRPEDKNIPPADFSLAPNQSIMPKDFGLRPEDKNIPPADFNLRPEDKNIPPANFSREPPRLMEGKEMTLDVDTGNTYDAPEMTMDMGNTYDAPEMTMDAKRDQAPEYAGLIQNSPIQSDNQISSDQIRNIVTNVVDEIRRGNGSLSPKNFQPFGGPKPPRIDLPITHPTGTTYQMNPTEQRVFMGAKNEGDLTRLGEGKRILHLLNKPQGMDSVPEALDSGRRSIESIRDPNLEESFQGVQTADEFLPDETAGTPDIPRSSDDAVRELQNMKPYSWLYKKGMGDPGEHTGVMADDVEKAVPEAVEIDPETGLKNINFGNPKLQAINMASLADLHERLAKLEGGR